ncbi:hypothetical protein DHEL01_v209931 [Diaporthe helianthi]|uniref:Uncharacterized protein n=1 Tax=Diaporthe helianthi TaxID=158607 RepID=A0A2P5HN62_DIAHE|nr:hypothetical protein DHEL01_v209931 [Diaporthe helianthi]
MLSAQRPAPKFSGQGTGVVSAAAGPGDRVWWLLAQAQDFQTDDDGVTGSASSAVSVNAQAAQTQAKTPQTHPAGKQNI